MSGSPLHLPMMADCERALGRPQRALALAKDIAVDRLDEAGRVEMKIVESGARRDLGDFAAAVRTLEGARAAQPIQGTVGRPVALRLCRRSAG